MNQLLGNLIAYEMRLPQRKSNVREVAFKTEKNKDEKEDTCSCSDEEEAKSIRKLERGSGKYKGKIPFKCFNCGRVGHYVLSVLIRKQGIRLKNKRKRYQRTGRKERNSIENLSILNKIAVHLKTQMNPQVKKEPLNLY